MEKIEKYMKQTLKNKVKITKALMIAFLINGGFALAENNPITPGTNLGGENATAIGSGSVAAGSESSSIGTNTFASGNNMTKEEYLKFLKDNKERLSKIELKMQEIKNDKDEIQKLRQEHDDIISKIDRINNYKKTIEDKEKELNEKEPQILKTIEEKRTEAIKFTKEIEDLEKRIDIISQLDFSKIDESNKAQGVEILAKDLKQKMEDGQTWLKQYGENGIALEEYKNAVLSYIDDEKKENIENKMLEIIQNYNKGKQNINFNVVDAFDGFSQNHLFEYVIVEPYLSNIPPIFSICNFFQHFKKIGIQEDGKLYFNNDDEFLEVTKDNMIKYAYNTDLSSFFYYPNFSRYDDIHGRERLKLADWYGKYIKNSTNMFNVNITDFKEYYDIITNETLSIPDKYNSETVKTARQYLKETKELYDNIYKIQESKTTDEVELLKLKKYKSELNKINEKYTNDKKDKIMPIIQVIYDKITGVTSFEDKRINVSDIYTEKHIEDLIKSTRSEFPENIANSDELPKLWKKYIQDRPDSNLTKVYQDEIDRLKKLEKDANTFITEKEELIKGYKNDIENLKSLLNSEHPSDVEEVNKQIQEKEEKIKKALADIENLKKNLTEIKPGSNALAYGTNSAALGKDSIAFGTNNIAINELSIAFGTNNFVNGNKSIALGYGHKVIGENSISFGVDLLTLGKNNTNVGQLSQVSGEKNQVVGFSNEVKGDQNLVIGNNNRVISNGEVSSIAKVTFIDLNDKDHIMYVPKHTALKELPNPSVPNKGFVFKEWNLDRKGTGTSVTKDTIVDDDMIVYQIDDKMKPMKFDFDPHATSNTHENESKYNIDVVSEILVEPNKNNRYSLKDILQNKDKIVQQIIDTTNGVNKPLDKSKYEIVSIDPIDSSFEDNEQYGGTYVQPINIKIKLKDSNKIINVKQRVCLRIIDKLLRESSVRVRTRRSVGSNPSESTPKAITPIINENVLQGNRNEVFGNGNLVFGSENKVGTETKGVMNNILFGNKIDATNVNNAIVFGNESKAIEGAVSFGNDTTTRQLKFVAKGIDDTDAVNFSQLKDYVKKNAKGKNVNIKNELLSKLNYDPDTYLKIDKTYLQYIVDEKGNIKIPDTKKLSLNINGISDALGKDSDIAKPINKFVTDQKVHDYVTTNFISKDSLDVTKLLKSSDVDVTGDEYINVSKDKNKYGLSLNKDKLGANIDLSNNSAITNINTELGKKANLDASNVKGTYLTNWQSTLGTGKIEDNDSGLVNGGVVKTYVDDQIKNNLGTINTSLSSKLSDISITGDKYIKTEKINNSSYNLSLNKDTLESLINSKTADLAKNDAITNINKELDKKANKDASNLDDKDVENWQNKLGNGTVTDGDTKLVKGGTVFTYVNNSINTIKQELSNKATEDLAKKLDIDANNLNDTGVTTLTNKLGTGEIKDNNNNLVTGGTVKKYVTDEINTINNTVSGKLSSEDVDVKGDEYITVNKDVQKPNHYSLVFDKDKLATDLDLSKNTKLNEKFGKYALLDGSNLDNINLNVWQAKLGNGEVKEGNTGLVKGGDVFTYVNTIKQELNNQATQDLSNKLDKDGSNLDKTSLDKLTNKLSEESNLTTPTNRLVTDSKVSEALKGKLNVDADNLSNTGITNLTDKLGKGTVTEGDTGLITGGKVYEVKKELDNKYTTLNNQVTTNTKDISKLKTDVEDLKNTKQDITKINNKLGNIDKSITNINNKLNDKLDKTDLSIKGDKYIDVKKDNKFNYTLSFNKTTLENDLDLTNNTSVNNMFTTKLGDINTNIGDLKTKVETNTNNINSLTTKVDTNTKDIDTLKQDMTKKLNVDADNLTTKGETNLINKLSKGSDISKPNNKLVTDTQVNNFLNDKFKNFSSIDNKVINTLQQGVNVANNKADLALAKSDLALNGISNAVAMANLPQVASYGKYKHMLTAAYGNYAGVNALALGLSGTTDSRRITYKISGAVNTKGNIAFGTGIGVMLGEIHDGNVDTPSHVKEQLIKSEKERQLMRQSLINQQNKAKQQEDQIKDLYRIIGELQNQLKNNEKTKESIEKH